jgi:TonB family protein
MTPPAPPTPQAPSSVHPERSEAESSEGGSGGGSPGAFMDDLTGVAEGDGTFLNTREWKYASFFNRLKEQVAAQWKPRDVLLGAVRLDDFTPRVTIVNVTIDSTGAVIEAEVASGCGYSPLDNEATRAFRRASPFPNPPEGLFENGSTFSFQFGFRVDAGPRTRVRP